MTWYLIEEGYPAVNFLATDVRKHETNM